jgi:hypothetical protein
MSTVRSMLDDRVCATLASGSSHLAAVTAADGTPFAMRGWGATVNAGERCLRVLLDAADVERLVDDGAVLVGSWIAYTAASVRTLTSFQLKGRVSTSEAVSDADRGVYERYCEEYYAAVLDVDFIRRELMERMEPEALVAVEFEVEELFDQSPGPGAGRAYGAAS